MCKRKAARAANRGCPGDQKATESGSKRLRTEALVYAKQESGGRAKAAVGRGRFSPWSRPACALSLTRPVRRVGKMVLMADDWVQTTLLALFAAWFLACDEMPMLVWWWSVGGGDG